ncbi:MAG: MTH1187 family thiamine-binding protein [archaeon]|nr:MTH1187 family thiamine-binding protein [archaeon]
MSVIAHLALFPVDKGESLSKYVADSIHIIESSGLPYKLGPMGTSIEGEWNEVMNVISQCFESLSKENNRVYMTITADYRKGKDKRLTGKLNSVEKKLGRKVER